MYVSVSAPVKALCIVSKLAETIAAVDGTTITWLERDFTVLPALSAYRTVHLPILVPVAAIGPPGSSVPTTRETAFGLVRVAFGREELLFLSRENEVLAAVYTLKGLLFETHWVASCPFLSIWL